MDNRTDKKDSDDKILGMDHKTIGFVLYAPFLVTVLNIIHNDFYPLSFLVYSVIFFILMLVAYPIFIRNSQSFRPQLGKSYPFIHWFVFSIVFSATFALMRANSLPLPLPAYSAILLTLFLIMYPLFIRSNPNRSQIRGKPFRFIYWLAGSLIFAAFSTFVRYAAS